MAWNRYIVKALNLNNHECSIEMMAATADDAAQKVVRKNKYLRVQSVEKIEEKAQHFEG